jgi:hypothetical protein
MSEDSLTLQPVTRVVWDVVDPDDVAERTAGIVIKPGEPQEHRLILPPDFDPKTATWFVNVGTEDEPKYEEWRP